MPDTIKPLFSWRGAITESDLPPTTRHVALALSLHMNERGGSAFPGPALLAKETGLHISTVKEKLAELERAGWLHCAVRGGMKGERRCANQYEATIPGPALFTPPVAVDDPSPATTRRPERGDPSPSPRAPVAVGDPSTSMNSPVNSPIPRATILEDFETWWTDWPRKVEKARARGEYTARRRQHIPAADLLAARDHYAASVADSEPRFVKHASSFLHGPDGPWSEWVYGPPKGANTGPDLLGATRVALDRMR